MKKAVRLLRLPGPAAYADFLGLQDALLRAAPHADCLVVGQHGRPVYTAGRREAGFALRDGPRLRPLGAECHDTGRGGQVTWHGPGQLMLYPLLDLRRFCPSIRWYVAALEAVLVRTCAAFGVPAGPRDCSTPVGAWTAAGRKIGFVGIRNTGWLTSHGAALNVSNDLAWFDHIVPCGLDGVAVTSLQREAGPVDMARVQDALLAAFAAEFDVELVPEPC